MLLGQLRLHLGLEHQGQGRMGTGTRAVQLQRLLQRHLGLGGTAFLQIADAQLDIGVTGLIAPRAALHRILIAG
ncbi:hypothetical protein D3C81_2071670 [compost metagenome]